MALVPKEKMKIPVGLEAGVPDPQLEWKWGNRSLVRQP